MKEVWLAVAVLMGMKAESRIVQVTRTQQLNWWSYNLVLIIQASRLDLMEAPEIIQLPGDVRLVMIVEGQPRTCYCCRQNGHIKKNFS